MKLNKIFSALMLIAAGMFAACNNQNIPENPDQQGQGPTDSTTTKEVVKIPTEKIEIPEGAITVSKAREICEGLESGAVSEETYFVHGWVKKLHAGNSAAIAGDYHNAQFYICENQYTDGSYDKDDFYAYHVKGKDNSSITDENAVQVGDYVVLKCKLTNFNGTYETPNNSGSYIYASTNPLLVGAQPATDIVDVTVAEAIQKAQEGAQGNFRVTVTVVKVSTAAENVPSKYTNINMTVKDATGSIDCYYTNYLGNKPFDSADQIPPVGSKIKVVGPVVMYTPKDGEPTPEFKEGYIEEIMEIGDGSGEVITDATVLQNVAEAIQQAQAGAQGNFELTAIVKEVKTAAANVPSKYTNINMVIKDETGEIDCYYTNYIDNKPFTSADQIPPVGTKLTVVGALTLYGTDKTPEFKDGYIKEIIEVGQGEQIEGDIILKIENTIGDWTFSESKAEYYGNGGLKVNKEGMALTSPELQNTADAVLVSFKIGALNTNQATGKNGEDGNNWLIEGLNAAGEVIASAEVKTPKADVFSAVLNQKDIAKVRLSMVSFPYNGSKYCNVNLSYVTISFMSAQPAGN